MDKKFKEEIKLAAKCSLEIRKSMNKLQKMDDPFIDNLYIQLGKQCFATMMGNFGDLNIACRKLLGDPVPEIGDNEDK